MLILILAPAAWADSDSDSDSDSDAVSIVGSWDVVFALPSGDAPGFFTFDSGETWFATGSQASLSPAHGAWEQTGSRTFAATNKGFIYATDGSISLLIKNSGILEVSPDGDSFTAAFLTEISIPGGPVVSSFSGTATGTRIQVD
ncbi:MAG: hypothetical protein GY953_55815 [bacterium]|nr:hypothetical protein [bacterium]